MKILLTLLLIIGFGPLAGADPLAAPTDSQKASFQKQVQSAFASKDAKALLSLYCVDRVEPAALHRLETLAIPEMLKGEYADSSFTEVPSDAVTTYTRNGVTYAPNLTPVIALVVKFKEPAGSATAKSSGPSSITMMLGLKAGSLLNICAAPTHL